MEYYHVRITQKSNSSHGEVKLDLSLEELEDRFLSPYRKGLPIVIGGKSIPTDDIDRVRISKTDQDSSHFRKIVEEERRRHIATGFLDFAGPSNSERIVDKGEDITDEFITGPPGYELEESNPATRQPRSTTSIKVFISHSDRDVEIAKLLVELLRNALHLRSNDIRCTSVDGYRMQGGASIDERLRSEVHDAELLIGLITPTSLRSAYVIFELGARWGAEKPMIPLLASGATPEDLEGPLAGINALDSNVDGQVHQLLEDTAGHLNINLDKPSSYASAVKELVRVASESTAVEERLPTTSEHPQLSEDAKELLIEAKEDENRLIIVVRTMTDVVVMTNRKHLGDDKRSQAKWLAAIEELLNHQLVERYSGEGEAYEVTHRGFQVADSLANGTEQP